MHFKVFLEIHYTELDHSVDYKRICRLFLIPPRLNTAKLFRYSPHCIKFSFTAATPHQPLFHLYPLRSSGSDTIVPVWLILLRRAAGSAISPLHTFSDRYLLRKRAKHAVNSPRDEVRSDRISGLDLPVLCLTHFRKHNSLLVPIFADDVADAAASALKMGREGQRERIDHHYIQAKHCCYRSRNRFSRRTETPSAPPYPPSSA